MTLQEAVVAYVDTTTAIHHTPPIEKLNHSLVDPPHRFVLVTFAIAWNRWRRTPFTHSIWS